MDLHPTVLGIPLSGQSYKEKSGRSVAEPYEYEKLFPLDDLAFLKSRVREIYHSLGVQELRDLANEYVPTKELRSLLDTDSGTFELMSSRFCDVVDFAHQSHVDYRRNLFNTYREQGYRRGLAELARLLLKVLKLR
jgi:hypothetical protein